LIVLCSLLEYCLVLLDYFGQPSMSTQHVFMMNRASVNQQIGGAKPNAHLFGCCIFEENSQ